MADLQAKRKVKATISAVIYRADGRVEDLGVIAETKSRKAPAWLLKIMKGGIKNG